MSGSNRSRLNRPSRLPQPALDRRTLLTASAAVATVGLGAGLGLTGSSASAGQRSARATGGRTRAHRDPHPHPHAHALAEPTAPFSTGTTLETVAAPRGSGGYRRLTDGPGWQRELREELAGAKKGREDKRTTLASFVQFTDLHMVDVQHPVRYEYLRAQTASAWRPQEALSVAGAVSLIERVNRLRNGPATGAPLSFVMTTGDNTDNNSRAELEWFLTAMSGGRVTPNTGDADAYEGVQSSGLKLYWQPESHLRDSDKQVGFPRVEGLLRAAIREVNSPGLALPWYSTIGNHDALSGGCFATGESGFLASFAVGGRKLMELDSQATAARLWGTVQDGTDPRGEDFQQLLRSSAKSPGMRSVTADLTRAPFSREEYVRAHLRHHFTGAGPVGHGYSEANVTENRFYYTFRISDRVTGISLDTTRADGNYKGRVGSDQLRWLAQELKACRADGQYVLVFSHHTSATTPEGGDELLALLGRNPHVLAWINGHSHKNNIIAHDTFWEVSTASHIDYPQLARVLELTDNGDGTLSLFATLVESAAPHETDFADLSQTGLAALYRELAFNAPGVRDTLAGKPKDRNTELVLRKP
jgi:metallophosphoesterase (TIGR03767 family)